jgi:hypothetical protein
MNAQEAVKTEKTDFQRDFQENSSKYNSSRVNLVARGAGFEPARPKGPQA